MQTGPAEKFNYVTSAGGLLVAGLTLNEWVAIVTILTAVGGFYLNYHFKQKNFKLKEFEIKERLKHGKPGSTENN